MTRPRGEEKEGPFDGSEAVEGQHEGRYCGIPRLAGLGTSSVWSGMEKLGSRSYQKP